jgi:hypothetical protein
VCARGFAFLQTYTEEFTSKVCVRLLQQHLVSNANRLFANGDWSVLWDNDSTHTSNFTRAWLQQVDQLTHSLSHSLSLSLTHTHRPTHSLTHSLPLSLTHSLIHSLTHSLCVQGLILQHIIKIPARSPDINFIENVWPTLAAAVEKHNCRTQEELITTVNEEWPNIEKKVGLEKIGKTMISRCQALIKNRGHYVGK